MEKSIYIGFGNSKGGVGKTTLTEVVASILYYERKYQVVIIDCDEGQHSVYHYRDNESAIIQNSSRLANPLVSYYKDNNINRAYDVLPVPNGKEIEQAEKYLKGKKPMVVLFDHSGRSNDAEMLSLALSMDYLVVPIEVDEQSLTASLAYVMMVHKAMEVIGEKDCRLKEIWLVWNKMQKRFRNSALEQAREAVKKELGANVFESNVYSSTKFISGLGQVKYLSDVFRSTFISPRPHRQESTGIDCLVSEIEEKIIKQEEK